MRQNSCGKSDDYDLENKTLFKITIIYKPITCQRENLKLPHKFLKIKCFPDLHYILNLKSSIKLQQIMNYK